MTRPPGQCPIVNPPLRIGSRDHQKEKDWNLARSFQRSQSAARQQLNKHETRLSPHPGLQLQPLSVPSKANCLGHRGMPPSCLVLSDIAHTYIASLFRVGFFFFVVRPSTCCGILVSGNEHQTQFFGRSAERDSLQPLVCVTLCAVPLTSPCKYGATICLGWCFSFLFVAVARGSETAVRVQCHQTDGRPANICILNQRFKLDGWLACWSGD